MYTKEIVWQYNRLIKQRRDEQKATEESVNAFKKTKPKK
jgi:hypothetical protein